MTGEFLPGTLFLIDTSAYSRTHDKRIREIIMGVIDAGMAATCVTIDLEAAFSARDAQEMQTALSFRDLHFRRLPITAQIEDRARTVMRRLAIRGLHRAAGAFDVLTAAIAENYRATVLHYDADFEHIASITGQQQQWIAPRGSID